MRGTQTDDDEFPLVSITAIEVTASENDNANTSLDVIHDDLIEQPDDRSSLGSIDEEFLHSHDIMNDDLNLFSEDIFE